VIVHSHSSAEYIQKEAELKEKPVVIPHGTYIPSSVPDLPDKFTPGYMGSLGFDKGVIYLFRAIITSKPEINLIIGGREAQNFNIEDKYKNRFTVYGLVDNLYEFYKTISIGIFPSVTEGFGICGLECLAHGRPIITTPGTGVSELIQDGREGFIVPIRNSDAIKEKLEWFAENPSEIQRMGKNAQQLSNKFDWKNIKKIYRDVIEELMG
jgi:glycosyltransferase involved in cell wall biosynthesis